jgi:hypothetical protein
LSICSGIEKNLNFLEDNEGKDRGFLSMNMSAAEMQHYKNKMKRFSLDDLRRNSGFTHNFANSHYLERLHQQQMGYYHDLSEYCTNSDYSHHSTSNYSGSPNKMILNQNNFSQPCVTNINILPDRSRRNSNDPNIINLVRDLVANNNSKSARNSIDFSNVVYPFPNVGLLDDKYILDNVLLLLKDQSGCRLIQKKLEEKPEIVASVFEAILQGNLTEIINDQFGNYVVQKLIDNIYNDKYLVSKFFELIQPNIFIISINQYGTRVFQRLLDYFCIKYGIVETPAINDALKTLIMNYSGDLIMDTNGNHVFQKILMIYPKQDNQFIFDELMILSIDIAKSKKGGSIFQRAFEFANLRQKVKYY